MAETPCFFVLKESALQLLADLGSLTDAAAQVIQLGAANITAAHGFDLLDEGGVDGEHLLDADAVGKTTNGEGLLKTAVLLRDDDALEDLDTLAGAFLDLDMNADGVADVDDGHFLFQLLGFELFDEIHGYFPPIYRRS